MMTYAEMCGSGSADPEKWKAWLEDTGQTGSPAEALGLLPEEYADLSGGLRSMGFYVFKKKYARSIFRLWAGCYVKYLFEHDLHEPHFEYGWVDVVNNDQGFCKIQCDDSFNGNRAVTVRIIDVMEVLPLKERPLVYYKTMICGQCNKCDRIAAEPPPMGCPHSRFLNALLSKSSGDSEFHRLYQGVLSPDDEKNL